MYRPRVTTLSSAPAGLPPPGLPVGTAAPPLRLPQVPERMVDIADFRGSPVVVAFQALAFTGGPDWGVEGTLRAFERSWDAFQAVGARLVVVTSDSMYANQAFMRSLGGLRFPIVADFLPRGAVSRAWNAWAEDREHPRNVTFILDRQGGVRWCQAHHKGGMPDVAEVLAVIQDLDEAPGGLPGAH